MKRLQATVHGNVQGVFFRSSTRDQAQSLGVTGWVRNERDGSVRVVAEGEEAALNELLAFLNEGPSQARVNHVETEWSAPTGEFDGFEVRH